MFFFGINRFLPELSMVWWHHNSLSNGVDLCYILAKRIVTVKVLSNCKIVQISDYNLNSSSSDSSSSSGSSRNSSTSSSSRSNSSSNSSSSIKCSSMLIVIAKPCYIDSTSILDSILPYPRYNLCLGRIGSILLLVLSLCYFLSLWRCWFVRAYLRCLAGRRASQARQIDVTRLSAKFAYPFISCCCLYHCCARYLAFST